MYICIVIKEHLSKHRVPSNCGLHLTATSTRLNRLLFYIVVYWRKWTR